jgi:rhamnogalacturonan endolyase
VNLAGKLEIVGIFLEPLYYVSNHWSAGTPNITDSFDRTFGPQYYHFNRGVRGGS